jgi:hypothetical protein
MLTIPTDETRYVTYVTHYYHGFIVDEKETKRIANELLRNPTEYVPPQNCYGYIFNQYRELDVIFYGEKITLKKCVFTSPFIIPDGKIYTLKKLQAENTDGNLDILIGNIERNSPSKRAVKTRMGGWIEYTDNIRIITKGEKHVYSR